MKFYNRTSELVELNRIYGICDQEARMTVITGRRRIGKTYLAQVYGEDKKVLYLFVSKKAEELLCQEYTGLIEQIFPSSIIGQITSFKDIFLLLMRLSEKERFVLIVDEFQEWMNINPSIYSELQNVWDSNKRKSKLHCIFIGSIYNMMVRIFQDQEEPLFGRAENILYLNPFDLETLKEILEDNKAYTEKNRFDLFMLTGGVPRYIDIFQAGKVFNREAILDEMLRKNSLFINEGKNILIEEFGKEYQIYFSILELISSGKTERNQVQSVLGKDVGGHLEKLENVYDVIERIKPINAKPNGRLLKYRIKDNILNFWFRFINKNKSSIEINNMAYVREIVKRDIDTYSGKYLELYFQKILMESGAYNRVGNYWESGNRNEIDIVAINDMDKKILIGDVKLNQSKLNVPGLEDKARELLKDFQGYTAEYKGFSL